MSREMTMAGRQTLKQRIRHWLLPRLPVSRHVFNHLRLEQKAFVVRTLHRIHPIYRRTVKALSKQRNIKANIGCGFSGLPGWVNLDLLFYDNVTLCADVRWAI